jgi:hypothetical protein
VRGAAADAGREGVAGLGGCGERDDGVVGIFVGFSGGGGDPPPGGGFGAISQ